MNKSLKFKLILSQPFYDKKRCKHFVLNPEKMVFKEELFFEKKK